MSDLPDLTGKRVAIIATDHFEESELTTPRDSLEDAGADVRIFAPHPGTLQAMQGDTDKTISVRVDGTLDEFDQGWPDAFVFPGGTVNADHLRIDEQAQRIITNALESGAPVAAICHAPWLLVSADLVKGKRLTSFPSLAVDVRNAGGDWVDETVVVDGNLITSRNPDDLPAFVGAIADALVS
ncbi:type 1 glutamine amidotransferase [Aeromicrobium senzhongii]|uniref:Type 1 glutamine amidotransferase n=1 Tax=Aeromicrobium senzhongii TaxID=2663859 RepID=A0ABX6SPK6_9ACTN|nr:type 1 glutamine amidotransferase domain-containing protein [Aeromicrobium senzhongii]MTB86846.1 DJ-1/PfpI/YhbO family deglycase/protease [Aeromicrobium senzhongii]QNL93316.1 type 1 glutamine amidotransferase [Aeromicrobium senzhongii]